VAAVVTLAVPSGCGTPGNCPPNTDAVCSTKDAGVVRSLRADEVIDYTCDDFAETGECYHVIYDAVGKLQVRRWKVALDPSGLIAKHPPAVSAPS
jgi:hypothetical protein